MAGASDRVAVSLPGSLLTYSDEKSRERRAAYFLRILCSGHDGFVKGGLSPIRVARILDVFGVDLEIAALCEDRQRDSAVAPVQFPSDQVTPT